MYNFFMFITVTIAVKESMIKNDVKMKSELDDNNTSFGRKSAELLHQSHDR